jgi:hypothetical protein
MRVTSRVTTFIFSTLFFKEIHCTESIYSYKIVPLTNLNKYLHHVASVTEVNINISENNGNEKLLKKTLRLFSTLWLLHKSTGTLPLEPYYNKQWRMRISKIQTSV